MSESKTNVAVVAEATDKIKNELAKAVVGQKGVIDEALIALLCEGHVLLEGVPGVAKTLIVRALALAISADSNRIQFTPDLMPSDVIGTNVFDPSSGTFSLRRGPIFTGLLLADEINRTPPKTQAALLEAMQEKKITIDGEDYTLDPVFTVFATQNPIEYEGTYALPEAQLDRFMFKTIVPYPAWETEVQVLARHNKGFRSTKLDEAGIKPAIHVQELLDLRKTVREIVAQDAVVEYVAKLTRKTRENPNLTLGASPRAGVHLLLGAKAVAAMNARDFVIPDDVKRVALPVLRHRLILRAEAEIEGVTADRIIESTLAEVEVPRQ